MQRINALLRTVGIVGVCGLAALALPRPAHAGGVHVSLGFGLPVPVFVAPPPPVVYPAPPVYVYPRPWSSTPRSWCNHRWCMDSPPLGATPPTGAMGGPGDTAIMTTATMQRMDNTGAPTAGTAGAASNEEEEEASQTGCEHARLRRCTGAHRAMAWMARGAHRRPLLEDRAPLCASGRALRGRWTGRHSTLCVTFPTSNHGS